MSALLLALAAGARALRVPEAPADPWPTMRGPFLKQFGASDTVVPRNLSAALAWKWRHPGGRYHTVLAGGPVIDAGGNFYQSTSDGIRKLSPSGEVLWHHAQPDNRLNNQPALLEGRVFGSNQNGEAFALDTETGAVVWSRKLADSNGGDCGYPAAYDGVFMVGAESGHGGGNVKVFALDSATGATLWQFAPAAPVWNFAPLFTADGRVVFQDLTGGMYALGLHDGQLFWHTPVPGAEHSFSDGGAVLGPLGDAFSCSNPTGGGDEGSTGLLRRLSVADGSVLWSQLLPQPCNSYPAVGKLGPGQDLSVAVLPGSFMGRPDLHGSVMAFDVLTGVQRWQYNAEAFTGSHNQAKGDIEGLTERKIYDKGHEICLPAHWSSANIDGDGFIYGGRANGRIYGVRGPSRARPVYGPRARFNRLFVSSHGLEVEQWDADGAALHGAFAFAPGTVAIATCDTLYVFKA